MKKNTATLIIFLFIGLLAGTLLGQLVSGVHWLSFLTKSTQIEWSPSADLQVFKYDLHFWIRLNLASFLGLIVAFWMYRRW
jgi:H+/Cl- antiporter ClcA